MPRSFSLFVALYAFWLLMSGLFDNAFLLLAGACSAAAVTWLAHHMEVSDREGHPIHLIREALMYWPWLLREIWKSGIAVSRIILNPRLPISPTLVRFRPSQVSAIGITSHANSITLTPGTITVEASPDEFLVHGLTRDGAEGCIDSEMDHRVTALEEDD